MQQCLKTWAFAHNENCFNTVAGTDNNTIAQACGINFCEPNSGKQEFKHYFRSLESHLSRAGTRQVEYLAADPDSSLNEKWEANELLRDYLIEHPDEAFSNGLATAFCLIHPGRRCPIFSGASPDDTQPIEQRESDSLKSTQSAPEKKKTTHDPSPHGDASGCRRKLYKQIRWTLVDFGSCCIDFASFGSMMRFAGPSAKPYHIAIAQI